MNSEEILNDYTFDYESGPSNSYLVVQGKNHIFYKNYQVEMITCNSISGLLPFDLRQKNNITGLYYNITSKITLSQYISHKELNRNDFINLLFNIVKTLLDSRKYLLSSNSFILYEDYIFINPSTQQVFLTYLPVEQSGSLTENLKRFIVRILVEKAKFDESANDNFLQKILEYIRNENFSAGGFYTFLNTLRTGPQTDKKSDLKPVIKNELPQKNKQEMKNPKEATIRQKTKKELDLPFIIPDLAAKDNKQVPTANKASTESSPKDSKSNPVILAVLVQTLVIIIFFLGKGYLITVTDDPVSAYGGTGLTLLALDILVTKKIFNKKDEPVKVLSVSKRSIVSDVKIPAVKEDKTFSDSINESFDSALAGMDETAVLFEKEPETPYLTCKHDGIEERINISKNSFRIGRLQGQVDYVSSNNAVGKVHAEILTKGNLYFLKDLNSRNGSFINGDQIVPNKDNEIKSGDRISIANSDFTFFAPAGSNG